MWLAASPWRRGSGRKGVCHPGLGIDTVIFNSSSQDGSRDQRDGKGAETRPRLNEERPCEISHGAMWSKPTAERPRAHSVCDLRD